MKVIILAAGEGYQLDGFNKLMIKDPATGERIIDKYIAAFKGNDITVVVGFRAIAIMNEYPNLKYVFNSQWRISNNSYSLSLALNDEPCYVLSSDFLFDSELISLMNDAEPNCVLTENRENRTLTALNCVLEENKVKEIYQGPIRNQNEPEAIGIYKISDSAILGKWKTNCQEHGNLFIAQNLPFDEAKSIYAVDKGDHRYYEINTPLDYINLIDKGY